MKGRADARSYAESVERAVLRINCHPQSLREAEQLQKRIEMRGRGDLRIWVHFAVDV